MKERPIRGKGLAFAKLLYSNESNSNVADPSEPENLQSKQVKSTSEIPKSNEEDREHGE